MWITGNRIIFLLFLVVLTSCSDADNSTVPKKQLKILAVFAHLGKSHFDVFKPLLEELSRRGHDLTVISHFPRTEKAIAEEPLPTYKDISLRNEELGVFVNVVDLHAIDSRYFQIFTDLYMLYTMSGLVCDIALKNPEVKQLVDSGKKFDLMLVESFNTNCFMVFVHKFNVPFIQISTHQLMTWAIDDLGVSNEASYIPSMFTRLPRPMNFFQRMINAVSAFVTTMVFRTLFNWRDYSVANEFYGPGIPDLKSISNNASLMFVNTHYSIHGAISFPPNVIEIGGIHISPKVKPLPPKIKKFLDEAHEGVLYFNLGSMVKMASMPEDKLKVLIKVFTSIPRKVIWKWEVDGIPDNSGLHNSNNVLIEKWLPQYDILNHPNVKCYFGHGGLLGLSEGVQSGVPMVLMPFFGDQYQNAIAAQARGVALMVDFVTLNEQTLKHTLDEIFNNTRYRENAKKLSKAFKDRPNTPLETAVWWTEYVGRGNASPYIRSEAANMSWCQRNLIDVMVTLAVLALLSLYVSYRILKCILTRATKRQEQKNGAMSKKRD
ncbi:UDP-glucosyltransferase 2-like [Bombus flavifrons]|uniref:UDP-glucosyltransferase 2-like n=1 Tax=Bombus flavifrons TaxID=103934 RepID=UPI003704CF8B